MICPVCKRKTDLLRSAIKSGKYLSERCERCLASFSGFSDYARKYERDTQRRKYEKDIIQRYEGTELNPEFVDAYPEQFDGETRRDYGIKRKQF